MSFKFTPIGTIHSPYKEKKGMPIQPAGAKGVKGHIDLLPEYKDGIKDLEGFSHIYLLYVFHQSDGFTLQVVPFLDTEKRGLFSTRAPRRPNNIGLSVVELVSIDGLQINIKNVDMLDGTPLLDIKPFVDVFDYPEEEVRAGWLTQHVDKAYDRRSDERFGEE